MNSKAALLDLAHAMREGSKQYPKCEMTLFDEIVPGQIGCCALGAALAGKGATPDPEDSAYELENMMFILGQYFPDVDWDELVTHPQMKYVSGAIAHKSLVDAITNLNDAVGLHREEIADWIEEMAGYHA